MKTGSFFLLIILTFFFWLPVLGQIDSLKKNDSLELTAVKDSLLLQSNSSVDSSSVTSTKKKDLKSKVSDIDAPDVSHLISPYKIFWSIVFLVLGYFLIKSLSFILNVLAEKSTNYRIAFKGAVPIVKIVGWILLLTLIIVGVIKPPTATVLAFSASIGVAVGFASQDILKNIFGGIVIIFDQPFKSGDKIEVGSYYGEVVEIGLRSTRIVTPDDSLVSLPNSEIMNKSVSNSNAGEANCLVVAEIYLPIDIDTVKVRAIAIQAASVSKYVFLNKPIGVLFFNEVKERRSFLKMRLKAYVRDIRDEFIFKSEMTELVIRELVGQGILKKEEVS